MRSIAPGTMITRHDGLRSRCLGTGGLGVRTRRQRRRGRVMPALGLCRRSATARRVGGPLQPSGVLQRLASLRPMRHGAGPLEGEQGFHLKVMVRSGIFSWLCHGKFLPRFCRSVCRSPNSCDHRPLDRQTLPRIADLPANAGRIAAGRRVAALAPNFVVCQDGRVFRGRSACERLCWGHFAPSRWSRTPALRSRRSRSPIRMAKPP